jgi:hypothetical protein
MEKITQKLNSQSSVNSVNTDTFVKVKLDNTNKILPSDVINEVVNAGERFNTERQRSKYYRILGTINPTISNPLFNLSDTQMSDLYTWKGFNFYDTNTNLYRFNSPSYPSNIDKYLKEKDGWFGYFDPDTAKAGFCLFYDMEPKRQRFSFLPDNDPYHGNATTVDNWELTITYPASIDSGHTMVLGGLMMIESTPAVVGGRNMTAFGLACQHNLNIGDIVRLSGTTNYDGDHIVVRTGLDDGNYKPYYFVLDLDPTAGFVGANARMTKMIGDVESRYYFRKFRKVKTKSTNVINQYDYEVYKLGFSENVFNDDVTQFMFNQDIDITDLVDNLGRPLSELYLTFIKTNSNNLFTNVSSGIETPAIAKLTTSDFNTFLQDIPVINRIHNSTNGSPFTSHIPLENNVTFNNSNTDFYGDLVEYNTNVLKETVLAEVYYRFNTINREDDTQSVSYQVFEDGEVYTIDLGPRHEGYYYKAHHLIRIRNFSTYIEQGNSSTVDMPSYVTAFPDGRYLWRDLIDIGSIQPNSEVLDYPFINGSHYMYDNYCFTVKRQDPFDFWGLYYANFPADPIGQLITDKYDVNTSDDVC